MHERGTRAPCSRRSGVAAQEDVAEGDPGVGGRGPPGDRTQPRDEGRALESRVAGLPRELGRPLEVGLALAGPAEHEAGHPDLPVRPCEIGKVTGELECRGDLECLAQLVLDLRPGSTLVRSGEIEARVRLDRVVSDSPRFVDRGAQDRLRSLELAAARESVSELGQHLEPPRVVGREEVDAALQEANGCGEVGTSAWRPLPRPAA